MRSPVASIVVTVALAASAAADGGEEAAQEHLVRGVAAFESRDFARAHQELTAARDLAPHKPNPYRWLALTEVQLGDCAHALANIDAFGERAPADDPRRAELIRLRELCGKGGVVTVTSKPVAGVIRVDGKPAGTTPATLQMREGHHTLTVEKSGYEPYTHGFDMTVVGERAFSFDLVARRSTPIYRRWWFWTAAGAAVITVAGIALLARGDDTNELPPIHCNTLAGCLP
ncbi:MAG: PEGA domain-containing protein [Kofleriaceae bacterium]